MAVVASLIPEPGKTNEFLLDLTSAGWGRIVELFRKTHVIVTDTIAGAIQTSNRTIHCLRRKSQRERKCSAGSAQP
jgi:hypothetical protein